MTIEQLAAKCGINSMQIRHYEGGFREPKFFNLKKLAIGLGTDIGSFHECKRVLPKDKEEELTNV